MFREEINYLVKNNKNNIIEYLLSFDKVLISNYNNNIEELCNIFNFDLKYIDVTDISIKSYLKFENNKFLIVINKKLKDKEKELEIYKELITYFIIRYFVDEEKIKADYLNTSQYYFHYPMGNNYLEIDYISTYFSKILFNSNNPKNNTKKNEKELKKLKQKLIRMEKNI